MDEKTTMTATFEPTLEVRKLLEGKPTEYVVVNPVAVEAELENGRVVRYPQEIRERVVRCRDCRYFLEGDCLLLHVAMPDMDGGFCAWGEPREDD